MFLDARAAGRELFGFAEHQLHTTYLGTSTGLRVRHAQPTGRIEVTGKTADWSRSTWVGHSTRDFTDIDMTAVDADLTRRLAWAKRRVELDAGRYETVLPPSAVADLMAYLYWSAIARDADEGRTVFSRQGGGTRVGERLADMPLRVWSDPAAEGIQCDPYVFATSSGSSQSVFDNGLPLAETDWIADGELKSLITTRHSAGLTGLANTPGVDNLLMALQRRHPWARRDGRRHLARPAAHLPLVHPRGRPADPAPHRPDP